MDDIFKNIRGLQKGFIYKYGITPNAVFVGYEEYFKLAESNQVWSYTGIGKDISITTVFGIKIHRINKENHLSVGVIIE